MMLSSAEITAMRQQMTDALPDVAVIKRNAPSSDGGDRIENFSNLATGVSCRLMPLAGGETGESGDRAVDETTHVITFSAKQDITEADQVEVGGTIFEVTHVAQRGEWELSRRVEVKERP